MIYSVLCTQLAVEDGVVVGATSLAWIGVLRRPGVLRRRLPLWRLLPPRPDEAAALGGGDAGWRSLMRSAPLRLGAHRPELTIGDACRVAGAAERAPEEDEEELESPMRRGIHDAVRGGMMSHDALPPVM